MMFWLRASPGDSRVHPDKLELRMLFEHLLDLIHVLPAVVVVAHPIRVVVDLDGEVLLNAEFVDEIEGGVVASGDLLVEQHRRQVVVSAHDLANAAPHFGVLIVQPLDVVEGREVRRVEGGERRRDACAVLVLKCQPRVSDHLVRIGIHVAWRIVVLVVEWLLGSIKHPLLAARHAEDQRLLAVAAVHRQQRRRGARRFLEEVEQMKVAVDCVPLLVSSRGRAGHLHRATTAAVGERVEERIRYLGRCAGRLLLLEQALEGSAAVDGRLRRCFRIRVFRHVQLVDLGSGAITESDRHALAGARLDLVGEVFEGAGLF
mmetsp:Transcript_69912/g.138535  ORF Transcript_69912/g.138535 Transcript_69912/m.138535 type:complete len:317 (+) Transcript_69912:935-1885(+)